MHTFSGPHSLASFPGWCLWHVMVATCVAESSWPPDTCWPPPRVSRPPGTSEWPSESITWPRQTPDKLAEMSHKYKHIQSSDSLSPRSTISRCWHWTRGWSGQSLSWPLCAGAPSPPWPVRTLTTCTPAGASLSSGPRQFLTGHVCQWLTETRVRSPVIHYKISRNLNHFRLAWTWLWLRITSVRDPGRENRSRVRLIISAFQSKATLIKCILRMRPGLLSWPRMMMRGSGWPGSSTGTQTTSLPLPAGWRGGPPCSQTSHQRRGGWRRPQARGDFEMFDYVQCQETF